MSASSGRSSRTKGKKVPVLAEPRKTSVPVTDEIVGYTVAETSPSNEKQNEKEEPPQFFFARPKQKNIWASCCVEVDAELTELNTILTKIGLPPVNYRKEKSYPLLSYDYVPDMLLCQAKDFLDFFIFPYLLPAIQSLILFAQKNRVFQCRYCTFNSLDYIVEHLYNNNPRCPERMLNPTPLFDIPFAHNWLKKYPRAHLPKWMIMSEEEACVIIQRCVRGFLVRKRPEIQELRQFWIEFRKDAEEERANKFRGIFKEASPIYSPYYYDELSGETDDNFSPPSAFATHSDVCTVCTRFRDFLHHQEVLKQEQDDSSEAGESGSENNDYPPGRQGQSDFQRESEVTSKQWSASPSVVGGR